MRGANLHKDCACWRAPNIVLSLAFGVSVLRKTRLGDPKLEPKPGALELQVELAVGAGGARLLVTYVVHEGVTVQASWRPCQASGPAPALAGGVGRLAFGGEASMRSLRLPPLQLRAPFGRRGACGARPLARYE